VKFDYDGDGPESQMFSWFKKQLKAIETLWDAGLPEASLTIIYSGIDSFGLLAAPPDVLDASGKTFKQWCEKYILTRLQSVDGTPITSEDLWGARCGVLHTSTPLSRTERDGKARQVFYQFKGRTGVNMALNTPQMPILIDVATLGFAFKHGATDFCRDLNNNPPALKAAEVRAQHFLRWTTFVP
jgi:hypothetical protein